jgi:hypothetical protein
MWPNIETRPNFEQRPALGSLPNLEPRNDVPEHLWLDERGGAIGRSELGSRDFTGHVGLGMRPTVEHRSQEAGLGHGANAAQMQGAGYGSWYHGDWHDHWDHRWNHRPATWWGPNWWGAGYDPGYEALSAPWAWGYFSYDNPYSSAPSVVGDGVVDYSQPLALAGGSTEPPPSAKDQALQVFNMARDAFQRGDYPLALTQINQALGLLPSDLVLNEFRGLVLFALRQYPESAAMLYAVLSAGPGWDWTTLSNLYPDTDEYTAQLRALEQYVRAHPFEADIRFLLGYHYLTCGYTDAAATQLAAAAKLNPKDRLSTQLLASLTAPNSTAPGTMGALASAPAPDAPSIPGIAERTTPAGPVTAASLTGTWSATRQDGGRITLSLDGDSKYDWRYTANAKTHDFSGRYQLTDDVLILRQGNRPTMVGQVTPLGNAEFNFKMAGNNASDPGLKFTR